MQQPFQPFFSSCRLQLLQAALEMHMQFPKQYIYDLLLSFLVVTCNEPPCRSNIEKTSNEIEVRNFIWSKKKEIVECQWSNQFCSAIPWNLSAVRS